MDTKQQIENLEARVNELTRERSYFQLMTDLMKKLSTTSGLGEVVENLLSIMKENTGANNICIYYYLDGLCHAVDFHGTHRSLGSIDDRQVLQVFKTGEPIEISGNLGQKELNKHEAPQATNWLLPLKVGSEVIGVLKIEEIVISASEMKQFIDLLLNYTSLLLHNKINNLQELKRVNEQLRKSNEHINFILDATNTGTWEWNVQTGETIFNGNWARMLGYTLEELGLTTIKTWSDLCHPDDLEMANLQLDKYFNREIEYYESEFRLKHKDGRWVWVFDRGKVSEWTDDGKPLWMSGTHQDITDRKKAEHRSLERLKELGAFYKLSELIEKKELILDELYLNFVNELPESWQYSEITCARIAVGENEFKTANFSADCKWCQSSLIKIYGSVAGRIDIGYLEERPDEDEGPFLKEERLLIDGVAERLGHIIERRQAEEALRESEERVRLLLNSTAEAIYGIDLNGNCTFCNAACIKQLGYNNADELLGKNMHDQIHFKHADGTHFGVEDCRIFKAFQVGENSHVDDEVLWRADGTCFPAEYWSYTQRSSGKIVGAVVTFLDITERKQAEKLLIESEQRYHQIFDNSFDAFLLTVPNGSIKSVNPATCKMFGRSEEEICRLGRSVLVDMSDSRLLAAMEERSRTGKFSGELTGLRRDGTKFPIELASTLLKDSNGNWLTSMIIRDITERKQAERKLERANRLYAVISQVNQAFVHNRDRKQLFDEICRIAIGFGKFRMAWIGMVDETSQEVIPVSIAGHEEGYLSNIIQITYADQPEGRGPVGTAIREDHYFVCNDIATDPRMALWREQGMSRGYRSVISLPLRLHDEAIGAITIYSEQADFFNAEEIKLLEEVAYDISYAIDAIETEKEHRQAEVALTESEAKFRNLVTQMQFGLAVHEIILDEAGKPIDYRFLDINPSYEKITGIKRETVIGKTVLEVMPGTEKIWIEKYGHVALTGEPTAFENYAREFDRFFSVVAYQPQQNQFAVIVEDITSRKKTEEALQQNERKFHTIFNSTTEAIFIQDSLTGIVVDCNQAALTLYGFTRDELLKAKISDFISFDEVYTQEKAFEKIKMAGEHGGVTFEWKGKRKNKKEIWTEISLNKSVIDGKERIVAVVRNIDERKKMEEALHETNTYLENLINYANAPIIVWDINFKITRFNHAFELLTGYTEPEMLGKSLEMLFPPEKAKNSMTEIYKTLEGEHWETVEIEIQKRNKSVRTVLWNSATLYAPDGKTPIATIAQGQDITERKQAEELLRQSEEKYRLITENASDVIWILNISKGKFTYISPAIQQLRGLTVEEALAETLEEALTPESAKFVFNAVQENIQDFIANPDQNSYYINQVQQPCKDGNIIWVEVSTKLRFNKQGEIEVVGVSRNIEERKKMEAEIRENEARLRETNATKDKFFSIISHDLRNPFASFMGLTELMVDNFSELSTDGLLDFLLSMRKSAQSTYHLLENLLEWSRLQQGAIPFNPEPINLKEEFKSCDDSTVEIARKKSITINMDIPDGINVFADRNMLRSVMRNLVTNAIKFTNPNGAVTIHTRKMDEDKILFSVKDTGIGMDAERIKKLFRIDTNVSRPGTNGEQSTGLGLILCKEFIEKHGGTIWAESETGKGSTFFFTIPQNR